MLSNVAVLSFLHVFVTEPYWQLMNIYVTIHLGVNMNLLFYAIYNVENFYATQENASLTGMQQLIKGTTKTR